MSDVPLADLIVAVDRLPMEVDKDTIRLWLAAVLRGEERPRERVEALIALQDRLALLRRPALFEAGDREKIEEWLFRIWNVDDVALVDAAATLILSQGLDRGLLLRTLRHGSPETAKIAKEALDES